jgi:pilus assembly protein CpaB
MKSKSLMLFTVAAGCGLIAMIGARQLLARNQGSRGDSVPILVARQSINPGVRLTPELVVFKEFPRTHVPEGAVTKEAQYADRALKSRAYPGQPILLAQLGEKGQFGTSVEIPPGMRLATLKVDPTMIHSGIMRPGDRVDVILTYQLNRRGGPKDTRTRTILQYIQVFAMGNQTMGSDLAEKETAAKDVKGITLLVTPIQAQILKYAESKGELHLTLRSVLDKEAVVAEGTDEQQLERLQHELSAEMNEEQVAQAPAAEPVEPQVATQPSFAEFVKGPQPDPQEAARPAKPVWKVEVFQGDDKKVYQFEIDEAVTPTTDDSARETATRLWSSWQRWFSGRGRSAPSEPLTSSATP